MRGRLLSIGLALITLHALGVLLPRSAWCDPLFAVESYRALGIVPLVAASALLLLLLCSSRAANLVGTVAGRTAGLVPGAFRLPILFVAGGAAFYMLTNQTLSGDAGSVLRRLTEREVYPSNALTNWIWHAVIGITRIEPRDTIRIVACAAGVVYVGAAVGIARQCFEDTGRRIVLMTLLLTAGTMGLFFGTLEVYAPLAAGIALYVLLGLGEIRDPNRFPFSALCLGIVFCLHGSAGLLLPSLLLLQGRSLRLRAALFLLPIVVVFGALYFGTWGGDLPGAGPERYGTFLGAAKQGPLLPLTLTSTNLLHRYAILDLDHLLGVLNLWLLASPVGLLLFLTGGRLRGERGYRFVLVIGLFLALFPLFWNVSYPLRRDWDLFSPVGIPLALLGALTLLGTTVTRATVTRIAALSLFTFVPLVLTLAGSTADDSGSRALFTEAMRHALAGRFPQAESVLRELLERDPGSAVARESLGVILLRAGRTEEARAEFDASVRKDPGRIGAWLQLAEMAIRNDDPERAIRLLERGIRAGTMTTLAGPALLELARLREERGETDIADELRRLGTTRGAK